MTSERAQELRDLLNTSLPNGADRDELLRLVDNAALPRCPSNGRHGEYDPYCSFCDGQSLVATIKGVAP